MEHERNLEAQTMKPTARRGIDRREFLKRIGGGVVVLITLPTQLAKGVEPTAELEALLQQAPRDFNAFLRIGEDGRVTLFTGKIEMGQGIITSLPPMLADELDVLQDRIDIVLGDTDLCPFDAGTWGSLTTRVFGPELRAAGAQARRILLELASESLSTPVDRLGVEDGVVFDRSNTTKRISYAALTEGKAIARELEERAPVKTADQYRYMGKNYAQRDAVEKVTGKARYAADIRLPGMLVARIVRPPAHGATLNGVDTSRAEAIDGVRVVRDGDLVAVLHAKRDVADRALQVLEPEWEVPAPTFDDATIYDHLMGVAPAGEPVQSSGDVEEGEQLAAEVFDHTYYNAYVAHAPIEPHVAVASLEDGKMTIWASTQSPFGVKRSVVSSLGFSEDQVRVITPPVGGGFGGKSSNGQALQAARLAKLAGVPVQVFWTREDEFFWDTYRPAAIVKVRSGLTAEGAPSFWDYRVYFAGGRGSEQPYTIPHLRIAAHSRGWGGPPGSHPFATGAWRAPAANTNVFAVESQIDIMAAKAGIDPLEFRMRNLTDKKFRRVLESAAERFGWTSAAGPSGRGYGVACGMYADTVVAAMAAVEVDRTSGRVTVRRVVCAQDMGLVVNPQGAILQMEGCIMMGMGYALTEGLRFRGGEILDLNFDRYELPRFSWTPEIETILIDSEDPAPHGGGEPAIILMGAVIANAVFDATGARLFELPMTPERIRAALG